MTQLITTKRTKRIHSVTTRKKKDLAHSSAVHLLKDVFRRHQDVEQMLTLLGWQNLPQEVLIEIMDDLQGFADELSGRFSTLCPYVQNRRKRVIYWVDSVLNGICSTTTAAEALHIS